MSTTQPRLRGVPDPTAVRRSWYGLAAAAILVAAQVGASETAVAGPLASPVTCPEPRRPEPVPAWAAAMPEPVATQITKQDVDVVSYDGTRLSARVYRPETPAASLPTVLVLSPYHAGSSGRGFYFKEQEDAGVRDFADCLTPFLVPRGYAVVLADMRATRNSEGCLDFGGRKDQQDGAAVVEWIASQPWSNGKVGMYGVSHVGMASYATAVAAPPALKAIIAVAPVTSYYRHYYSGGAHYQSTLGLFNAFYEGVVAGLPPTNPTAGHYASNIASTTCNTETTVHAQSLDGTMDDFWKERDYPSQAPDIAAAVFHVHGTRDENVKMDHFSAIWTALEQAQTPRKALIGPWAHGTPRVSHWELTALRWYEHWLKGNDTGMLAEPRVTRIDQLGTTRTSDQFDHGRQIGLLAGQGRLARTATSGTAAFSALLVPQQVAEMNLPQPTQVRYTTDPFASDVLVSGSPRLILHAKVNATDTNFGVRLYDVAPDGATTYVTRGYLDARHRRGVDLPGEDVVVDSAQRYDISLHAREYLLAAGHRLQLVIYGTEVDYVSPENSGVVPDAGTAIVTVLEGSDATRLVLPVSGAGSR